MLSIQGTYTSITKFAGRMFPSVTVCPYSWDSKTAYNLTILSQCGITTYQYVHGSKWSVKGIEECADPKSLHGDIILKTEDLIEEVELVFSNTSKTKVFPNETHFFQPRDKQLYGRCYTFKPSLSMVQKGIVKLKWKLRTKETTIRVFVNSNGVIRMKKSAEKHFFDVNVGKNLYFNLDHDLYKMLDFEGEACNNEKDYQLDECIINELENESMNRIGCVTPFGITKEEICTNKTKAKKALKIYQKYRYAYKTFKNRSCLEPCAYIGIRLMKASEKSGSGKLTLSFNELIHQTVSYYSYDDLSFVAEIGGYVGLFLGASVYQFADFLEVLAGRIMRWCAKN